MHVHLRYSTPVDIPELSGTGYLARSCTSTDPPISRWRTRVTSPPGPFSNTICAGSPRTTDVLSDRANFPLGTLYHGTKFAVEGISESLTYEMQAIGVKVKIV
jgi:NAD(P)-dependent dehydrogenase (short-subunit alcohol dehydrogenase family)